MLDPSQLSEMYYRMKLIRRFEEEAEEQYKRQSSWFIHFYIGQEARLWASVGIAQDDYITSTLRHGHLIAKGGQVDC